MYHLYSCHLSKIFDIINGKVLAEASMVCTARKQPCGASCFQVRQWFPEHSRHREFWQSMFWSNRFNIIYDKSEPVTHIHYRNIYCRTRRSVEYEPYGVFFSSYR